MKLKFLPFLLLIVFFSIKKIVPTISIEIEIAILVLIMIISSVVVYKLYKKGEIKKTNFIVLIVFIIITIISTFLLFNQIEN